MKRYLKKRLRSQKGETIAEVLIAMLISALALTMLAVMISSTLSMVSRSKDKMDEYYRGSAVLEIQEAPEGSTVENADVSIQSIDGAASSVHMTVSGVSLFQNEIFNHTVYAYRVNKNGE